MATKSPKKRVGKPTVGLGPKDPQLHQCKLKPVADVLTLWRRWFCRLSKHHRFGFIVKMKLSLVVLVCILWALTARDASELRDFLRIILQGSFTSP